MNWHKTNLALILLLLIIDLVLGVMLYKEQKSARTLPGDMVTEAVENLSAQGIVTDGAADIHIYSKPLYTYTVKNAFADDMREHAADTHPALMRALANLVGKAVSFVGENTLYFDIPDGLSLSVEDGEQGVLATAVLSGKNYLECTRFDFEKSDLEELCVLPLSRESASSGSQRALKSFFQSVYAGTVGFQVQETARWKDCEVISCGLTVEKLLLEDTELNFVLKNNQIVALYGDFFFDTPVLSYRTELLDGVNILYHLKLPEDTEMTLLSETLVYTLIPYNNRNWFLVPAWKVVYQTASGTAETCLLNALSGEPVT